MSSQSESHKACPKCGSKSYRENNAEYKCEKGHSWLIGGPL